MTERPKRDEAAQYYFKYIDQVPDGDILATLERQQDEVLDVLRTIPEEQSLHAYEPGKWTLREVMGHVNDCERLFECRAFWFARGFDTPLPSFDQQVAVDAARANEIPWARHLQEFRAVRESTRAFFGHLPEDAWTRRGIASANPFSVRALAYLAAGHVAHHLTIIRTRYLAR
jgi:hypothetical protein